MILSTIHIRFFSVVDPDPGSGAFLTPGGDPGSRIGKISDKGSDEHSGSYFLELRNNFLG